MPTLKCPCGHVINLTPIPGPDTYVFSSEEEGGQIKQAMRESLKVNYGRPIEEVIDEIMLAAIDFQHEFHKCPRCGRLIVFWNSDDPVGKSYLPEQ